jgi:hypothetical protein
MAPKIRTEREARAGPKPRRLACAACFEVLEEWNESAGFILCDSCRESAGVGDFPEYYMDLGGGD